VAVMAASCLEKGANVIIDIWGAMMWCKFISHSPIKRQITFFPVMWSENAKQKAIKFALS
jgi:hypothetical protein